MGTKIIFIGALVLVASSTIFSTCNKHGLLGCPAAAYNFNLFINAFPDNAEIRIGDTIWLSINSSSDFTDINSNQLINFKEAANLGSAIGFGEFVAKDSVREAANDFVFNLIYGTPVNNPATTKIREYLFLSNQDRYLFKIGIIPKKKGTFGIGFSNASNVYRKNNSCPKADFLLLFKNTNQHFYLNGNINSSNTDTSRPSGSYYFKVIP